MAAVRSRIRQAVDHLRPGTLSARQIASIEAVLKPELAAAFFRLPAADQVHLVCVFEQLKSAGWTDADLLQAALLHDIGKQVDGRSPTLLDRSAYVLLERFAPTLLQRLTRTPRRWNRGLYAVEHHPAIGAEQARAVGANARVCSLIARHADRDPGNDSMLTALQQADRAC